jgi:thiamine pyrophosphate-dependent acetolactate synthase large subunit-like protein
LKGGQASAKVLKMEGTDFVSYYPSVPMAQNLVDEGIRVITTRRAFVEALKSIPSY